VAEDNELNVMLTRLGHHAVITTNGEGAGCSPPVRQRALTWC
jgi:hypothetical protein